jgi:hypothetical protein
MAKTDYTNEQRDEALALPVEHGPAEAERRTRTEADSCLLPGLTALVCRLAHAVDKSAVVNTDLALRQSPFSSRGRWSPADGAARGRGRASWH